jgi:hypothetical protein
MSKMRVFVPIRKVDEENRLVFGTMTSEVLDKSGEVMDYATSKPFFEAWSDGISKATGGKSLGNVRVMHTAKAAGKLTDIVFDDTDRTIDACAKIVDDVEWQKVTEGVYTGFSIGGRYVKKWEQDGEARFTADPVEVSLVDNPCVPTATFQMAKADGIEVEVPFQLWQPSNDQVALVAGELAKAAADGTTWTDHIEVARSSLIKAKAEESDEEGSDEETDDEAAEDDDDAGEGTADTKDNEKKPAKKAKKVDAIEPVVDPAAEPEVAAETPAGDLVDDKALKVAPVEALVQVWKTTDGKTFDKKADATAHQTSLDADPLNKVIREARALIDEGKPAEPGEFAVLGEEVKKWHVILVKAHETFDEHCLAKGLYCVGRLAELMESLGYVLSSTIYERASEGDDSTVPEQLAGALKTLGAALVDMAQEEVAEMLTEMGTRGLDMSLIVPVEMIELSAGIEMTKSHFEKKGARNSKTDKDKLKMILQMAKELGAEDDSDDAEKLTKFATLEEENASFRKIISDALPAIELLKEDVKKLRDMPNGPAPKYSVIGKGEDNGMGGGPDTGPATAESLLEKFTPDQIALAAIKVAQRSGVGVTEYLGKR